jgi:hypothetical protein
MKRSAGVTAAAVVALLGGGFVCLLSVLSLFGLLALSRKGIPETPLPHQGPISLVASMGLGVVFEIGLAVWGLSTALGLLRLKGWSRISMLIFAGFLGVTAGFSGLIFMILPLPENRGTPENFNSIFRISTALFCAAMVLIAVWWLVLFTRKSVVAQFSGVPASVTVPTELASGSIGTAAVMTPKIRRPLTVTIIAWIYVASVPMMIPSLLISRAQSMPVPFFWTVLEGKRLLIYYALFGAFMLASGIGLLKNKAWAFWLAVGIQSFGLLNIAAVVALPGREARWERLMESVSHSFPPETLDQSMSFLKSVMAISAAGGFLFALAVLWLLWSRRKRFLEFAAMNAVSTLEAR